jgi:hypothetical protein
MRSTLIAFVATGIEIKLLRFSNEIAKCVEFLQIFNFKKSPLLLKKMYDFANSIEYLL